MALFSKKEKPPVEDDGPDFIATPQILPGWGTIPARFEYGQRPIEQMDSPPALAGIAPDGLGHILPVQNAESNLAFLRSEFPFVAIMPFPRRIKTIVFEAGNINQAVNIDLGSAQLIRFRGNADYYVSPNGTAVLPTVANNGPGNDMNTSLYKPESEWLYCGGLKQLSVVAAVPCIVTVMMYETENWQQVN